MKANRKFLNNEDEAVSPVIAVILMVAITVVLAATVYVWVSGFGSQSSNPAKTVALTSAGALAEDDGGWKNYTVASGTAGMKYSDLTFTVNGETVPLDAAGADCATTPKTFDATNYIACRGTDDELLGTSVVTAGDILSFQGLASGDTLRIMDSQANSVIYTLTVG